MKVLFEENIEDSDFLEIILSSKEYEQLREKGIVRDFPAGFNGSRNLNIFIRVDPIG